MRPKKKQQKTTLQVSQKVAKQAAIDGIETQAAPGLTTNVTSVTDVLNVVAKAIKDILALRIDTLVSYFMLLMPLVEKTLQLMKI